MKRMPGWRWLAFFLSLSMVVMLAHEITHHLVARAVCGAWGSMTWSTFSASPSCEASGRPWWIATAAGPILTYALIWAGALWRSSVGLVLLFANLPMGRIINVVTRRGDELIVGRILFGDSLAWAGIAVVVAAILAWPLWMAWKRLPGNSRFLAFPALLILPLFWDLLFKRMFLSKVLPEEPSLWGMPLTILATLAVSAALTMTFAPRRG